MMTRSVTGVYPQQLTQGIPDRMLWLRQKIKERKNYGYYLYKPSGARV